jgi:hypothetical protein
MATMGFMINFIKIKFMFFLIHPPHPSPLPPFHGGEGDEIILHPPRGKTIKFPPLAGGIKGRGIMALTFSSVMIYAIIILIYYVILAKEGFQVDCL